MSNQQGDSRIQSILIPLFSVLLGLLIGAIVMWSFGYDAVAGYSAMLKGAFGSPFYIGELLREATPLILVALGFAVANTAGFFNIGVAGQTLFGWLASISMAQFFPDLPKFVLLPLCILAGMVAGALWAGIAGVLRAYFNTSEVIVTIMLNHTALYINNHIVRNVLTDSGDATAQDHGERQLADPVSVRVDEELNVACRDFHRLVHDCRCLDTDEENNLWL